jgi:hypothetical protein
MDQWFKRIYTTLFNTSAKKALAFSVVSILAIVLIFSVKSVAAPIDNVATPTTIAIPVTTVTQSTLPTVVTVPATRATVPKLTPKQVRYLTVLHVNKLTYSYGNPKPAMQAFKLVAAQRGWTPKEIKSWEIAIANIMMGESGFCPNLLRGAIIKNPTGCVLAKQGKHSDSGFGQLISIHYRHTTPGTGWLCAQEKLCSKWEIIASPWNSMTSLLALIERSGVSGWCYNARARSIHRIACNNQGLDV